MDLLFGSVLFGSLIEAYSSSVDYSQNWVKFGRAGNGVDGISFKPGKSIEELNLARLFGTFVCIAWNCSFCDN